MSMYRVNSTRPLRTVRDALLHRITERLDRLETSPDPQIHPVATLYGELTCVLRAPVLWTAVHRSSDNRRDGIVVKGITPLVWTPLPRTKIGRDDFLLYINRNNQLVQTTLLEIWDKNILPSHLEILLVASLGQGTERSNIMGIVKGDESALLREYKQVEKDYGPNGMLGYLVDEPALLH